MRRRRRRRRRGVESRDGVAKTKQTTIPFRRLVYFPFDTAHLHESAQFVTYIFNG